MLIRNALQTPDGTVLVSRYRHDYCTHKDANGKTYMVDGGLDYVRRSANGDEIDMCVTIDAPHEIVREAMVWGTYGIDGQGPLRYVTLSEMSTDHIQAVLDGPHRIFPQYRTAMENELGYRNEAV